MVEQPDLFSHGQDADGPGIAEQAAKLFEQLAHLGAEERIEAVNAIRLALAEYSPMNTEPVDCVVWVRSDQVEGNAYNPNVVAPPELRLLEKSITDNGFTQPVVAWRDGEDHLEVVDGFHRHMVAKDTKALAERLRGRLPVAVVNTGRTGLSDRQAATVQHNAARGKHTVDGMAQLVLDLARERKSDAWIAENLGMDPDEVLRLKQTQGLAESFADQEMSEAWDIVPYDDGADEAVDVNELYHLQQDETPQDDEPPGKT